MDIFLCVQPLGDDATMQRHLSLAERMHRITTAYLIICVSILNRIIGQTAICMYT